MSHNTILVDGLGQAQRQDRPTSPDSGQILLTFQRGDDFVYFAGALARANPYPQQPGHFKAGQFEFLRFHPIETYASPLTESVGDDCASGI